MRLRRLFGLACMTAVVIGCGDDPGYQAGFQNLSDHVVLVRFDKSAQIDVGDAYTYYPRKTLFTIPAHASAYVAWVFMDWNSMGPPFGPPNPPGHVSLFTASCAPVAGFDVHSGDRPSIVIDASGSAAEIDGRPCSWVRWRAPRANGELVPAVGSLLRAVLFTHAVPRTLSHAAPLGGPLSPALAKALAPSPGTGGAQDMKPRRLRLRQPSTSRTSEPVPAACPAARRGQWQPERGQSPP